jgi:hypothetical protein
MAHRRHPDTHRHLPSVATVERQDESKTPFQKQLSWHPALDDDSLIQADRIFIKHGYAPSPETIECLKKHEDGSGTGVRPSDGYLLPGGWVCAV